HRRDRQFLDPEPTLLAHQLRPPLEQPVGRPAGELGDPLPVVERTFGHGLSIARGCDTYNPHFREPSRSASLDDVPTYLSVPEGTRFRRRERLVRGVRL